MCNYTHTHVYDNNNYIYLNIIIYIIYIYPKNRIQRVRCWFISRGMLAWVSVSLCTADIVQSWVQARIVLLGVCVGVMTYGREC